MSVPRLATAYNRCTSGRSVDIIRRNEAIVAAVGAGQSPTILAAQYSISRQRVDQIIHQQQAKARRLAYRARQVGKLIRPKTCQACQRGGRIEAHHHDYAKPLDVRWLCRRCHRAADVAIQAPAVAARQAERAERHSRTLEARRLARWRRRTERRHARGRYALGKLRELVQRLGRSPSYGELVTAVLGRSVKQTAAVPTLANWLLSSASRRWYWLRVQALYRLAGVPRRAVGEPGHVGIAA